MKAGILYGVGVGPGDPEHLTLKAARILRESDVIAVPDKGMGQKTAMNIVRDHIEGKEILNCETPMIRDKDRLHECYNRIADDICALLKSSKQVALITLGDPSIYSTYIYVQRRVLARGLNAEMIPGVPSFCAAAAKLSMPLCEGAQRLLIVPASHDSEDTMDIRANKVFMKAGSGLSELRRRLRERGLVNKSAMVQNCGMDGERIWPRMDEADETSGYFSTVICKEED